MPGNRVKKPWKYVIVLVLCLAMNYCGKALAVHFSLPVWLDTTGTLVATYYLGIIGGLVAAVLGNALYAIHDFSSLVYALSGMLCSLCFYRCIKNGTLKTLAGKIRCSFWVCLAAIVSSAPLNIIFYECRTGNKYGDALFDMLKWYKAPSVLAAIPAEALVDIPDKQICVAIACVIIWTVGKIAPAGDGPRDGQNAGKKEAVPESGNNAGKKEAAPESGNNAGKKEAAALGLSVFFAVAAMAGLLLPGRPAKAADTQWEYSSRIYNNRNGLMSSDANVIAETEDGYIWIGSYAGLTRYDGSSFEFITESGIANVTDMVCDSKGRLWIGTNDSGVARYEDGRFTFFRKESGLTANSVRCLLEGENGIMYVGTTDRICIVDVNDRISVLSEDMTHPYSMTRFRDMIVCNGSDGVIYVLKNGHLISTSADIDFGEEGAPRFTCVANTRMGLLAGTQSKDVYLLDVEGEALKKAGIRQVSVQGIKSVSEDKKGNVWVCGDDGFGYFEGTGFRRWDVEGFSSSIEFVHEDYQDNIWAASSSKGILCLSPTPFSNMFSKAGIEKRVCNAVIPYNGGQCVGTDIGLVFIDEKGHTYENEFSRQLSEARVRCVMQDSSGCLWACTYSEYGLASLSPSGEIRSYTTADSPFVTSDKPRCTLELSGGSIAVGTADGLYFIRDGEPFASITQEDGLTNSQILSLMEGKDGKLYAGSDGAGLFVVEGGRITGCYTTDDGLSSDVILRTVACDEGIFVVTSNSLCFIAGDEVTVLSRFPYYNNFDIKIDGGVAYVLSSAGVFTANLGDLCRNAPQTCSLYDSKYGFDSAITANSWSYISEDGRIYLCCDDSVVRFTPLDSVDADYRFDITQISFDGTPLPEIEDTIYIPSNVTSIDIEGSLKNFSLADVKVRFFVEELDADRPMVSYRDIVPIRILNPDSGTYTVRFQVFTSDGTRLLEQKSLTLIKETQLWEKTGFMVYIIGMIFDVVICLMVIIFQIIARNREQEQLELFNATLEQRVDEQTREISEQNERINTLLSETVVALARAVDAKDRYTSGHSVRVAKYSQMIAQRLGKSDEECTEIYRTGMLHDVGKISVPLEIINKPGKLTDEEYAIMKQHPLAGYEILKEIASAPNLCEGARYHHERYDGKGYPNGLAGEDIPEIGRIIGVADAYDAMASNRSYRKALPQDVIRREIEKCRGTQFDPVMADIMLEIIDNDPEYKLREPDR